MRQLLLSKIWLKLYSSVNMSATLLTVQLVGAIRYLSTNGAVFF